MLRKSKRGNVKIQKEIMTREDQRMSDQEG